MATEPFRREDFNAAGQAKYDQLLHAFQNAPRGEEADRAHKAFLAHVRPSEYGAEAVSSFERRRAEVQSQFDRNANARQFGPWFHGSATDMRPGTNIRPPSERGVEPNFPGYGTGEYAFATSDLGTAASYAEKAQNIAVSRHGARPSQRVYEVRPTGGVEDDPAESAGEGAVRSRNPWKVVRRVPASEWRK